MKKISLAIISMFLLSSCADLLNGGTASQLDYLDKGVKFDIKKFFNGDVEAFAIVQDSSGKIIDTESVKIEGSWDGNKGVIKKSYTLPNGTKDSRTWLITVDNGGTFTAIGHDIAAPGQGKQAGNAMQMSYSLLLPTNINGQKSKVNFDEKTYLVTEDSAIMIINSSSGFEGTKKTILSLKKSPASKVVPEKNIKTDE
jgi:hypothetical protein